MILKNNSVQFEIGDDMNINILFSSIKYADINPIELHLREERMISR